MRIEGEGFFEGLPPNKTTGFCQVEEGGGSMVVEIFETCGPGKCKAGECMMFKASLDNDRKIVQRKFKKNEPEY